MEPLSKGQATNASIPAAPVGRVTPMAVRGVGIVLLEGDPPELSVTR